MSKQELEKENAKLLHEIIDLKRIILLSINEFNKYFAGNMCDNFTSTESILKDAEKGTGLQILKTYKQIKKEKDSLLINKLASLGLDDFERVQAIKILKGELPSGE